MSTDLDVDLAKLGEALGVDLTSELPCEAENSDKECPDPARWRLHLHDCGHTILSCSRHRRDIELRAGGLPWHSQMALTHGPGCSELNLRWTWSEL